MSSLSEFCYNKKSYKTSVLNTGLFPFKLFNFQII
jgi:hypothetical protein